MPPDLCAGGTPGRRVLLGMLLLAVLAGCATARLPHNGTLTARPATRSRTFEPVIEMAGRLALRYEHNGTAQALDGKFVWNQTPDLTRIILQSPFGQTMATIAVTPHMATLTQSGQPSHSAPDVDTLTTAILGWPLPLAGLHDWLQGFATSARGQAYVASSSAAGDAAYVQTADGWLLHYPVWEPVTDTTVADSAMRPRRIDLQRETPDAGTVVLRIVLDQWSPH